MTDTTPEAEAIQLEIYRRMSPDARLAAALELSETGRELLAAGVRRRHPHYSEEQVRFAVLRLWLGEKDFELAYPDAPDIVP